MIGHTGRGDFGHELDTMWLNVPGVEVVAVADPVEKGLEKAKTRLGGVEGFLDFREMLAKVKPDIVSVAPRHVDQHAEMVIAAVEAGARGIYVEKPFSKTLAEADEMIAACEKSGTKLAIRPPPADSSGAACGEKTHRRRQDRKGAGDARAGEGRSPSGACSICGCSARMCST